MNHPYPHVIPPSLSLLRSLPIMVSADLPLSYLESSLERLSRSLLNHPLLTYLMYPLFLLENLLPLKYHLIYLLPLLAHVLPSHLEKLMLFSLSLPSIIYLLKLNNENNQRLHVGADHLNLERPYQQRYL